MASVTIRELRNQGGAVIDRAMSGEVVTITRDGTPVATLQPIQRRGLDPQTLLARWRTLPPINAEAFRADLDAVLDATL